MFFASTHVVSLTTIISDLLASTATFTFDLLTTVFMLTCWTRSVGACRRLLTRRRLWWFQLFHPRLLYRTRVPVVSSADEA